MFTQYWTKREQLQEEETCRKKHRDHWDWINDLKSWCPICKRERKDKQ